MKQRLLLVSAMMLTMSANALADGIWPEPAVETQALVLDGETEQYLYNVETKSFLRGANDWKTRASVSTTQGYKWKIAVTDAEASTYSLTDYCLETASNKNFNTWVKMFCENATSIWVDNNNGANANNWTITHVEDNKYTIGNTALEGESLGVTPDLSDTRVYFTSYFTGLTPAVEASYIWSGVSVEAYEAWSAYAPRYQAAVDLKAAIDAALAKYADLDLAAEQAVYNNTESTLDELNAALKSVADKLVARDVTEAENNASVENPSDLTGKIVNGTFDEVGNFNGWKGSGFGAGGTTSTCAERYQMKYDTWQDIEGLPNGVYKVTVDGFYRAGGIAESLVNFKRGTEKNAKVYATSDSTNFFEGTVMNLFQGIEPDTQPVENTGTKYEDTEAGVIYYVPNSMKDFTAYNNAGFYKTNSVVVAVEGGKLHLGVKCESTLGWSIYDNFGLTYYGKGADAYQLMMDGIVAAAPSFAADAMITAGMLDEYAALIEEHKTAATYAEVLTNKAAIDTAAVKVSENQAAWADAYAKYQSALNMCNNGDLVGDYISALADYLDELDSDEVFTELTLTTAEVKELAATINQMMNDAMINDLTPGSIFEKMVNPDFSTGDWTGWTHEAAKGGNVAVNASAKCAEAWNNSNFNIYQTIEGAPVGIYSIAMQGFYREGRGDAAWNLYFDEDGVERETKPQSTAYVYMNEMKTPLANVFDYPVAAGELYTTTGDLAPYTDPLGTYWYPNDMTAAGEAFGQGAYEVKAFGIVAKDGDKMQVGVKGRSNNLGDSWAIFDNFVLRFEGKTNLTMNKTLLTEEVAKFDLTKLMGSEVLAAATEAVDAANAALAGTDARAMFDALAELCAFEDSVSASITLFEELVAECTTFGTEIEAYSETARPSAVENAMSLYNAVNTAIEGKTYTNAQAEKAITDIKAARVALKIPADALNASDENPVDLTDLIATPNFDVDGVNSAEGWQGTTGLNFGNDATQKGALAVEFYEKTYDMYQEFAGMPKGTYKVAMNGFYRYGSTEQDLAHFQANEDGLAFLYATTDSVDVKVAVRHLVNTEDGMTEKLGTGSENKVMINETDSIFVPYDMVSAAAYFENGSYLNECVFSVGDKGNMRIGVKQEESVTYGWMIMDSWTLTFYGENSQLPSDIETLENANTGKVEFFNLAGQRTSGAQPGISVARIQMTDGTVKTVKIVIK